MTDVEINDLLDRLTREAPPATERYAYGPEPQQFGDLRLPAATTPQPWPVAIMIHGGYWRAAYDVGYFGAISGAFNTAGLATWTIEYRRLGDAGGGWPGTFQDAAAAADALRILSTRYPLDLSRTLALGHSAGGHLALWLAGRARLPADSPLWRTKPLALAGVIALAGVADLRRAWELRLSDNVTETLLGGSPEQVPDRYDAGSPYALLPLGIPQILAHGTRDAAVPFEMSQRYVERAQTLGDDARLVPMEDVGHFEPVDPATAAWRAVEAMTLSLLRA